MEPANVKPKRKWRQFSLRALLLVITVVGVWLGIQVNSARKQKAAVDAITKAGGSLYFDYQEVPAPAGSDAVFAVDPAVSPSTPKWLRDRIGADYFRTPITVSLSHQQIAQSELLLLANLTAIRQLQLDHTVVTNGSGIRHPVNDNDLVILKRMRRLVHLSLGHTQVDGSGLKHLAEARRLHDLDCQHSSCDDTGMEQISKLIGVKTLCLNNTAVTDLGLERIQGLTMLKELYLDNTKITDAGLAYIKSIGLKTLSLNNTAVTDFGLKRIEHLTMLEGLYLNNDKITDSGLASIMKLKNLTVIWLSGTDVTPKGIESLKNVLPRSQITAPLSYRTLD